MKAPITKSSLIMIAAFATTLARSQTYNTPLRHIIVVIQENRTPDNLFGADLHNNPRLLPGADLAGTGQCKTANPTTVTLKAGQLDACWDPDHSHGIPGAFEKMYDAGKMDDVCDAKVYWAPGCNPNPLLAPFQYQYVPNTNHLIDPYFNIAQNYGYANYMFQTNQGPSFPAHQWNIGSRPISGLDWGVDLVRIRKRI
jgi:phospholipase C